MLLRSEATVLYCDIACSESVTETSLLAPPMPATPSCGWASACIHGRHVHACVRGRHVHACVCAADCVLHVLACHAGADLNGFLAALFNGALAARVWREGPRLGCGRCPACRDVWAWRRPCMRAMPLRNAHQIDLLCHELVGARMCMDLHACAQPRTRMVE